VLRIIRWTVRVSDWLRDAGHRVLQLLALVLWWINRQLDDWFYSFFEFLVSGAPAPAAPRRRIFHFCGWAIGLFLGGFFLNQSQEQEALWELLPQLVGAAVIAISLASFLTWVALKRKVFTAAEVVALAVTVILVTTIWFAFTYYANGKVPLCHTDKMGKLEPCETHPPWNQSLSHVDALFVAFGTLTTAGMSGIEAKNELTHGLVLAQLIADLALITVMFAVVLPRLKDPEDANGGDP
jgi:hypothetical protein